MKPKTIQHIIKYLRRGTITWEGRRSCLRRARKQTWDGRLSKIGNKIYKYQWQCAGCKEWFRNSKDIEIDHITEIGPFNGDWNEYLNRMYCDDNMDNLQALCVICHMKKTSIGNATLKYKRKSPDK